MSFHCHPTKTALHAAVTPGGGNPCVLSCGVHTTQAVHPFTSEMVASGVEGEDGGWGTAFQKLPHLHFLSSEVEMSLCTRNLWKWVLFF